MTNIITSYVQLKSIFLSLMISDASEVASKLQLPEDLPIRTENIKLPSVNSLRVIPILGVGGVFDTTNWVYSYTHAGKLCYIIRKNPDWWRKADPKQYRPFAVQESALNTNRAYQLATNWLAGLSVDLPRLTKECHLSVKTTTILGMVIPEYSVIWSNGADTIASVWFLEPGKQLWQIRVEDPSYLLRPSISNGLTHRLAADRGP